MSKEPDYWTLEGFVQHFEFVHKKMPDHKYVWMLGAGASIASGIPSGGHLVDRWLSEMHVKECKDTLSVEEWATEANLGPDNFNGFEYEDRASFYSKIYDRRFKDYPEEGYAYLEDVMANTDPSPGYSILATTLAGQMPKSTNATEEEKRLLRHNAVITTNFDNLVADALAIYTDSFPFVCGHESLAQFVRVAMRRPLVCKIHRDLLLAPQNDKRSLKRLHDSWGMALRNLFEHYTPMFIGYGGNDDTLMDLLESLDPGDIKGQMIWCYYEKREPSERIKNLIADHNGALVPVPDFDLLMVLLGEKMGIGLLDEEIGRRAEDRTKQYQHHVSKLDIVSHPKILTAIKETLERSGERPDDWFFWNQRAIFETNPERKEAIFRQGLKHCPEHCTLLNDFAVFLFDNGRGSLEEIERLLRKANSIRPEDTTLITSLGTISSHMGNSTAAERLYRQALEIEPENAMACNHLARTLFTTGVKPDEVEGFFIKSIELDPNDVGANVNYSAFLLSNDRFREAKNKLLIAKQLNDGKVNIYNPEIQFYEIILLGLTDQKNQTSEEEIRSVLSANTNGYYRNFDQILNYAKDKVSPSEYKFYCTLADAILDKEKVPAALAALEKRSKKAKPAVSSKPKRKKAVAKKKTAKKTGRKS